MIKELMVLCLSSFALLGCSTASYSDNTTIPTRIPAAEFEGKQLSVEEFTELVMKEEQIAAQELQSTRIENVGKKISAITTYQNVFKSSLAGVLLRALPTLMAATQIY